MKCLSLLLLSVFLACSGAQAQSPSLVVDLGGGVMMDLVLVNHGHFTQGSPAAEPGRETDETQREVTLTRDFYMARNPVTVGQFKRFVGVTNYRTESEKGLSGGFGVVDGKLVQRKDFTWRNPGFQQTDEHPVVMVTYDDAVAFTRWLAKQAKRDCQLPTEAQWEYAARAGTTGARYAEPVDEVAWHRGNAEGMTHPVRQQKPNAWVLHDFYGPVWQWCRDWYAPYPPGAVTDPVQTNQNLSDKPRRVLRGGSCMSDVAHSRSAERYRNDPKSRNADNGFRVVCEVAVMPVQVERATPPVAPRPNPIANPKPATTSHPSPPIIHTTQAPRGAVGFPWVFLVFLSIPILILVMVVKAVSRRVSGTATPLRGAALADSLSAPSGPPPRFTSRMADDGFWISGPVDAIGNALIYTAIVNGRSNREQIVFTPGPQGHFIYTGARPSSVILQDPQSVSYDSGSSSMAQGMMADEIIRSSSSRSSSFPRAY